MDKMKNILVVDEDESVCDFVSRFLGAHAFKVFPCFEGQGVARYLSGRFSADLVILEISLARCDGVEVCKFIRQQSDVPIVVLTTLSGDADRILCLELGADDYLEKPFYPRELLARIRAALRRAGHNEWAQAAQTRFVFSGWLLDTAVRQLISPAKKDVPLTSGVYELLLAFLKNPQRVLSRDELLDFTKNRASGPFDRSIDVQVGRLRQKIEDDPKNPVIIKTVRSGGYMFAVDVE